MSLKEKEHSAINSFFYKNMFAFLEIQQERSIAMFGHMFGFLSYFEQLNNFCVVCFQVSDHLGQPCCLASATLLSCCIAMLPHCYAAALQCFFAKNGAATMPCCRRELHASTPQTRDECSTKILHVGRGALEVISDSINNTIAPRDG